MGTKLRKMRFSENGKKEESSEELSAACPGRAASPTRAASSARASHPEKAERPEKAVRAAAVAVRMAFAAVFAINVQCAVLFVLWPGSFAAAYELSGVPGEAAMRGIGVAFLMWNATYPAVIASPRRFRALAVVAVAQQLIGLAGESFILATLPQGHAMLAISITRFIAFDAGGLALMTASLVWLIVAEHRNQAADSGFEANGTSSKTTNPGERAVSAPEKQTSNANAAETETETETETEKATEKERP